MGVTKQRGLIRRIIQDSLEHLSAEQIYKYAQQEIPDIGLGTIYRNLNLMVKNGEVRRVSIPESGDRFDKTTAIHGHYHCLGCGRVFDVQIDNFALGLQLNHPKLKVLDYELVVRCLCEDCMKDAKTSGRKQSTN